MSVYCVILLYFILLYCTENVPNSDLNTGVRTQPGFVYSSTPNLYNTSIARQLILIIPAPHMNALLHYIAHITFIANKC